MSKKVVEKTTTVTTTITTDEKTQIILILDGSGSMAKDDLIDEAIGSVNDFVHKQKKLEDEATMTAAVFDTEYDLLYDNVPLQEVKDFSRKTWSPGGLTALNDAIGISVTTVLKAHKKLKKKDRPDKVLFVIVTDGLENRSTEYTTDQIKSLIADCEKKDGWSFIYLAANQDAFAVGTAMGFSGGNTITFSPDSEGMGNVSATLDGAVSYYRNASVNDANFAVNTSNLMDDYGESVDEDNKE